MIKRSISKVRMWIVGTFLLLVMFGFYWVSSPKKITVYPNRALIWRDFKQVDLISGRSSINAKCISTTNFEINRIFDKSRQQKFQKG